MNASDKSKEQDGVPLLHYVDNDDDSVVSWYKARKSSNGYLVVSIATNCILLAICAILSATILYHTAEASTHHAQHDSQPAHQLSDPYSPANAIVEYEYRNMIPNDTRFTGHPSKQWETNMDDLMTGTLLRISEEELTLYGNDSIPLKKGGYAAGLGIAHNLHCVKKLKKFLYKEHFYADMDPAGEELAYIQSHADHCLDFLRQSIMCHVDYSLYTVYWGPHQQDIPTHHSPGVQKCVNWDKLRGWMLSRTATTDELVRP